ncbi:MAG: VCBS repeat-containing protein [Congregibacter sp.]
MGQPFKGLGLALVFAGSVQAVASEEPLEFRAHPFLTFDTGTSLTADIELADVDGDGDLDAFAANGRHWAQQDYVFFNAGNGRMLEAGRIGETLSASYKLCPGDFDRDGDIDAVVIRDSLPAQLYLNDGLGTFSLAQALPGTGGHARSAAAADVDGDGWLDVVIARRRGADLIVYGNGAASFLPAEPLPDDGEGSTHIVIADIDADDRKDLVVARRNGQASVVMKNLGEREFEVTKLPGSQGDHRKAVVADVNGDGSPEVILVSTEGLHPVYRYHSRDGFELAASFGERGRTVQAMAAADLDGDGDVDLVEGSETANRVFLNRGDGVFGPMDLPGDPADTYGVALGDMNGDGRVDIVFANSEAENVLLIAR